MGLINLGTKALNLVNSGQLARSTGTLQAYKNDLLKFGAKPWDVKYVTQDTPERRMNLGEFRAGLVRPPAVKPVAVGDYTGDVQYADYQRVFGNNRLEKFLGDTTYYEVLHYAQYPDVKRLFRPSEGYTYKHFLNDVDEIPPIGFSLKIPDQNIDEVLGLLKKKYGVSERGIGEVNQPIDYGHFSEYMGNNPGYILGHTRRTRMPETLGKWDMIEEMQTDLNPYTIDRNLRQQHDIVLPDEIRDMLYVPEEIQRGKEQMVLSLAMGDTMKSGSRGLAVPPLKYMAMLRSHHPTNIPVSFRSMYGKDLDKRLKEAESLGLGKTDVVEFRDIPKFMLEGGEYSGRDWVNVLNSAPWDIKHEPFRVFRFNESAPVENIPMFSEGGIV